jgi:AcrR family transcriptional regulator
VRITHLFVKEESNPMVEKRSKAAGMRRQPRQARSQERVSQILDVAEQMFVSEGYNATTTNAIAARAQVPIGSLYQFFPDKKAILQALAERYMTILHEEFISLHTPATRQLSLAEYVDHILNATEIFFQDYPGYRAIYMQVQEAVPELEAIEEAADRDLIRDWGEILSQYYPGLETADYEMIAFILVKAIGNFLWLSLSYEGEFRQRLMAETRRLMLSYLQSYFTDE